MIPGRPLARKPEKKIFVAEQPGLFVSMAAMALSLFLGLAFRAAFSPERVSTLIRVAAQNIHPQLRVRFERAYLSLSDGLFPELAVVVENITADSEQTCWMQPVAKVDSVRLPLSFWELLRGRARLATVEVGQVDLNLRNKWSSCENDELKAPADPAVTFSPETVTVKSLGSPQEELDPARQGATPNLDVKVTRRNPVENVLIHSLRIEAPEDQGELDLRYVKVRVQPEEKSVQVGGSVSLPLANMAGASPHADFQFVYGGLAETTAHLQLAGHWREGMFKVDLSGDPERKRLRGSVEALHIPLSPLLGLLQQHGDLQRQLNGRQAWLSFGAQTDEEQPADQNARVKISGLKLEGDLGEIEAPDFAFEKLNPVRVTPFNLQLRGVRLEKLLAFLDIDTGSPSIGDWGTFNGDLSYQSPEKFELSGEHSGMQFIFANRGARETQTLSLIAGRACFMQDQWEVDLDRVRPLDGLFLGQVKIRADRSWRQVNFHLDLDEMSLNPEVQRLMTGGGSLGRWGGEVKMQLESGQVRGLQGNLTATDLLVENLGLHRLQVQMGSKNDRIQLGLIGKNLHLDAPSPLLEVFKPFLATGSAVRADQARLDLEMKGLSELKWKLAPLTVTGVNLTTEGRWDGEGHLTGEVQRRQDRQTQKWQITGTRDEPHFEGEGKK